jgi:hypothetical protein
VLPGFVPQVLETNANKKSYPITIIEEETLVRIINFDS